MRKLSCFIILIIFLSEINISAQDMHFSQFDSSPLNLNPALTGTFNGDHRIVGNHRNQWRSITVPYKTYAFSYDTHFDKILPINMHVLGLGIQVNADKAGDGDFGTTQIKLSPAFHKIIKKDSSLVISLGFNVAFNQNSLNYNALYFGNQWDGAKYNPDFANNEFFSDNKLTYFDYSIGTNVFYIFKNDIPLNLGIALNHINKPKQSFFSEEIIKLNRKFNVNINSCFELTDKADFYPSVIYFRQGKYYELNIGGIIKRELDDFNFRNLYFGGWVRARDAAIFKFGFDYREFIIGLSYDINFSKLRIASENRGGIEISVIYIFNNPKKYDVPFHKQCPVFM
ncbi:MAG: PorP/SprF family type IX secretion system membrane protein [Bacteroidota bacterium]